MKLRMKRGHGHDAPCGPAPKENVITSYNSVILLFVLCGRCVTRYLGLRRRQYPNGSSRGSGRRHQHAPRVSHKSHNGGTVVLMVVAIFPHPVW